MDFLGVGIPELIFVIILALIILGPKDIVKTGREAGAWLRKFTQTPTWKAMQDLQELPTHLIEDTGIDQLENEIRQGLPIQEIEQGQEKLLTISRDLQRHISPGRSAWTGGLPRARKTASSVPKTNQNTAAPAKPIENPIAKEQPGEYFAAAWISQTNASDISSQEPVHKNADG